MLFKPSKINILLKISIILIFCVIIAGCASTGETGRRGAEGAKGDKGDNGSIFITDCGNGSITCLFGANGTDGYTPQFGIDYFNGSDGSNGQDGANGIDGINGTTPIKGVDYFDGINGSDGANGIDGINGTTPIKGVDYFDGINGSDGTNGIDGINGSDGANGIDGINGTTPIKGIDYFDGINGSDGANGIDGINGTTPIKGVDYFDGINGTNGIDGINGTNGIDGINGTIPDSSQFYLLNGTRILTGILNAGGFNLSNLLNPVSNQDAATKLYVDTKFPAWQPWTPTFVYSGASWTGVSSVGRYTQFGKIVYWNLNIYASDSHGSLLVSFTVPVTAANTGSYYEFTSAVRSFNTWSDPYGQVTANGNTAGFWNFPATTNGQLVYIFANGFYEVTT